MIGELLVTAFVHSGTGYLINVTGTTTEDPLIEIADNYPLSRQVFEEDFLSRDDYASFNIIGVYGSAVIEVYLAPQDTDIANYQPDEGIIRAYAVPLTIPESGQFGLWGDEGGQFFEMEPGSYQVIAEARFLQRPEVPAYAELFPGLNFFLEREWNSPELRDDAPELWRLTFIPTDEPTAAVELYRELSLRERRQRGLE